MIPTTIQYEKDVKKVSLRQKVYELIRKEIITCELPPGQQLSEFDLADKYQVSKTPVREALTSLQQDALVEYLPNRGFMVSMISVKDVQEIYEARVYIESILFKLAIERITEAEIKALEDTQEVTYDPKDASTMEAYFQANYNFHITIAMASRNSRLVSGYRSLLDEGQRLIYMDIKNTNVMPIWHRSHQRFIDAIRNRDEAAAIATLIEVMENGKRRVLGGGGDNQL
jgi:DNA-binding GntR family transcriptional regulator